MKGSCWGKCNRCEHREPVMRKVIDSAKGARCSRCGGRLEVSSAQMERTTNAAEHRKESKERFKRLTGRE